MKKGVPKIKNILEEKKNCINSLRKLVEFYSFNTVVDQFFLKSTKKISDIEKIISNLKNKTSSAFICKYLYDNREELSQLYKQQIKINNELNNINEIKNENLFLEKKRKIKKKLFFDELKVENKNIDKNKIKKKYLGFKSPFKKNKIKKENIYDNKIDEEDISPKDNLICTHLLLNSYANVNKQEFLPEKTIQQRINSMREKIISIFPEITKIKPNNININENDDNKRKKLQ